MEGVPPRAPLDLMEKGHEIFICDITIFELAAKGGKYVAMGKIAEERILRGVSSILFDDRVGKIPYYDTPILLTAFELRKSLDDFIDCLVLSSAINQCEILITEDSDIQDFAQSKDFQGLIKTANPKFRIQSIRQKTTHAGEKNTY